MTGRAACIEIAPRYPALDSCRFYHAFDLIEGVAGAEWDLRADPRSYLGGVDSTACRCWRSGRPAAS